MQSRAFEGCAGASGRIPMVDQQSEYLDHAGEINGSGPRRQ
jgi:hypothetical protein